jgi:hypothetical protein
MLKTFGYGALVTLTAVAFVAGSATSSEAAKKKAKAAAGPPPAWCSFMESQPVCAAKGKQKFTYATACFAAKDQAKVVSQKACPVKAAKGKKAKRAMKKKAKKAA